MEDHRNCVACRRGLYRGRYQQQVLSDSLLRERPEVAAYIQQHAVLEVVFDNTRSVCHKCWQRAANTIRQPDEAEVPELLAENEQNVHVLMYLSIRKPQITIGFVFSTTVLIIPDTEYLISLKFTSFVFTSYIYPMVPEYVENILKAITGMSCLIFVTQLMILMQPSLMMFVTCFEQLFNVVRG